MISLKHTLRAHAWGVDSGPHGGITRGTGRILCVTQRKLFNPRSHSFPIYKNRGDDTSAYHRRWPKGLNDNCEIKFMFYGKTRKI